jgi:hypothetical protein
MAIEQLNNSAILFENFFSEISEPHYGSSITQLGEQN